MGTALGGSREPGNGGLMEFNRLPTPCYVVDEAKLIRNLNVLKEIQDDTGCKILLAQKAFSMFAEYPLMRKYLAGATSSSLNEARLGYTEMGGEIHIFSPAYKEADFDEIAALCGHIVFNSFSQLEKYRSRCKGASLGIRVNPEFSTQDHAIYDPCAPGSRLGVTFANFRPDLLEGVDGIHFHTLCEQNADDLALTLAVIEEKFGKWLYQMKWLNMGGGHHITRPDYNIPLLKECIRHMQEKYGLEIYLEPGEAVALNAGYMVSEVLDIVQNSGITTLILDSSASCHMPDVLEMPLRPPLEGSGLAGEKPFTYRLASCTCLAGDVFGDYSFDHPVKVGERLVFDNMAIYSMVKNNSFNGIQLPSIAVMAEAGDCRVIKSFGYEDFKSRLS
jgi:carboxynorspermidine decarboxylase